jgi:hypothetical protein
LIKSSYTLKMLKVHGIFVTAIKNDNAAGGKVIPVPGFLDVGQVVPVGGVCDVGDGEGGAGPEV